MKKIVSVVLALSMLFCAFVLSSCDIKLKNTIEKDFYNLVDETKELLDIVADDIYSNWYDAIYKDEFNENIDLAIIAAKSDNAKNLDTIEGNTTKIKELYKQIKDGELGSEAKAVMQAYNDYYTLVVEVSGSFNSYSASKETCKKELASTLDDFYFELD